MYLFAKKNWRHNCREQTYGPQEGKEGWTNWGDCDWHNCTVDALYNRLLRRTYWRAQGTLFCGNLNVGTYFFLLYFLKNRILSQPIFKKAFIMEPHLWCPRHLDRCCKKREQTYLEEAETTAGNAGLCFIGVHGSPCLKSETSCACFPWCPAWSRALGTSPSSPSFSLLSSATFVPLLFFVLWPVLGNLCTQTRVPNKKLSSSSCVIFDIITESKRFSFNWVVCVNCLFIYLFF